MYDDTGRLIKSVVTSEPEWDDEQVTLILAAERLEADFGPHGQPMSEATSPEADPAFLGGFHYEVNQNPIIDRAQYVLDKHRAQWEKDHPKAETFGHVWRVRRVDS